MRYMRSNIHSMNEYMYICQQYEKNDIDKHSTCKLTINLHVPTLSTSCAAAFILSGLPGTNPTAITRDCAPDKADARSSVVPVTVLCCMCYILCLWWVVSLLVREGRGHIILKNTVRTKKYVRFKKNNKRKI